MEESIDNIEDNHEERKKGDTALRSYASCSFTSERACKIPKNVSSDSEMEYTNLGELAENDIACSKSAESSMTKEDSGFAEKLSIVCNATAQDADTNGTIESEITSPSFDEDSHPCLIRARTQSKHRNYRKRSFANLDDSSNDYDTGSTSNVDNARPETQETNSNIPAEDEPSVHEDSPSDSDFDSEDNSDSDSYLDTQCDSDDIAECGSKTPLVLLKPKPKHNWNSLLEVLNRPYGFIRNSANGIHAKRSWGPKQFEQRYYSSLHAVQRLELMYKLQDHDGCVNSLCFNKSGSLLASGSDDLNINIWSWTVGQKAFSFKSGHRSNVFQSKFLPLEGDLHVVSSARDGQVRLSIVSQSGGLVSSRKLYQHRGMVHKISLVADQPQTIMSAGDDGLVIAIDLRDSRPNRITRIHEGGSKLGLFSIHCHPVLGHEFVIGAEDQFVRIYDSRFARQPSAKFKPLSGAEVPSTSKALKEGVHITSAVYNYSGHEILASYTNDDIYLFPNEPSIDRGRMRLDDYERDYIGRYTGHRNRATIKGANFFGPHSEYVLSGSDCSYCYIWDKKTESIVQWFRGDESGVVNCMEPHPHIPVIATSGLDHDVKIWVPSKEEPTSFDKLESVVRINKRRVAPMEENQEGVTDWIDGHLLWMFLNHVQHRNEGPNQDANEEGSSTHSDSSDDDSHDDPHDIPCTPS